MQKSRDQIRALQAEIIAFASRGKREDVEKTKKLLEIDFILIPGPNAELMREYGAFNYQKNRAQPSTVIVDKAGIIRWKYVGTGDKDRPSLETILSQLKLLQ